jgi:hypothetical protein
MSLDHLRELYETSTPERWSASKESSGHASVLDCQDVTVCRVFQQPWDTWQAITNAEFIALAHNAMPYLLRAAELLHYAHDVFDCGTCTPCETKVKMKQVLDLLETTE